MKTESVEVPKWILERMIETYRMLDNTYDFKKRESCIARNVMRDYCTVVELHNTGKIDQTKQLTYYMGKSNQK